MEPDVVITDLIMPGMDGFAMLRALTKPEVKASNIRLIVVSSLSPEDIAERGGLPAGVTYFQKPVHYGKLEELVHQYQRLKLQSLSAVQ
jgi:CheY-like chemotaxis protein